MFIKAAINGGRSKADHPAVPVTPQEQAAAIVECLKVGANAIHLHVRFTGDSDAEGDHLKKESLYPEDVAQTFLAVRAAAPKASVGLSTGAWILPHPARYQAAQAWTVLPDFASVNFSELGAVELTKLLLSRGVGVEAGLCDAAATEVLVSSGLAASCIRLLLEPQEQEMKQALEIVDAMEGVLHSAAVKLPPLLLHGTGATVWPMMDAAIRRGHDIRVGLEDTLVMPEGMPARDNVELVTEAVRRVQARGER